MWREASKNHSEVVKSEGVKRPQRSENKTNGLPHDDKDVACNDWGSEPLRFGKNASLCGKFHCWRNPKSLSCDGSKPANIYHSGHKLPSLISARLRQYKAAFKLKTHTMCWEDSILSFFCPVRVCVLHQLFISICTPSSDRVTGGVREGGRGPCRRGLFHFTERVRLSGRTTLTCIKANVSKSVKKKKKPSTFLLSVRVRLPNGSAITRCPSWQEDSV